MEFPIFLTDAFSIIPPSPPAGTTFPDHAPLQFEMSGLVTGSAEIATFPTGLAGTPFRAVIPRPVFCRDGEIRAPLSWNGAAYGGGHPETVFTAAEKADFLFPTVQPTDTDAEIPVAVVGEEFLV
jgi:hypothetical protein